LLSVFIIVKARGSKEVPFNISPSVPISSSVATASPTPLPIIAPAVGVVSMSSPLSIILPSLDKVTALPAFFASNALLAIIAERAVAAIATPRIPPVTARVPTVVNASVILPIPLDSAISSKGFKSSKYFSTSFAFSVPNPRSISSAPTEIKLSGILIRPDAIPAAAASKKPVSSDFFFLLAFVAP